MSIPLQVVIFGGYIYFLVQIVYVPVLLKRLHLAFYVWWVEYILAELILVGLPLAALLWWKVWLPTEKANAAAQRPHPMLLSRFFGLVMMVLVPLFALFVIPVGLWVSLPRGIAAQAGWAWFGVLIVLLTVFWAYARYVLPRRQRTK